MHTKKLLPRWRNDGPCIVVTDLDGTEQRLSLIEARKYAGTLDYPKEFNRFQTHLHRLLLEVDPEFRRAATSGIVMEFPAHPTIQ